MAPEMRTQDMLIVTRIKNGHMCPTAPCSPAFQCFSATTDGAYCNHCVQCILDSYYLYRVAFDETHRRLGMEMHNTAYIMRCAIRNPRKFEECFRLWPIVQAVYPRYHDG